VTNCPTWCSPSKVQVIPYCDTDDRRVGSPVVPVLAGSPVVPVVVAVEVEVVDVVLVGGSPVVGAPVLVPGSPVVCGAAVVVSSVGAGQPVASANANSVETVRRSDIVAG
jgi:hypothetical protein